MKLPLITAALTTLALTSCTGDSTQYNGYVANNTGDSIYVHISGGDHLLRSEVGIGNGDSAKVYFANADGDNEMFDCAEIVDSIWYEKGNSKITVRSSDSELGHSTKLGSDGTRIHHCCLEIK